MRLLYFVQLKEYRPDRFLDFIRYDKGKRQLFVPLSFVIYICYALALVFKISNNALLTLAIFTLIETIFKVYKNGLFRFKPTKKALLIFSSHLTITAIYLSFGITVASVAISYLLSPVLLLLIVAALIPVTRMAKELYIHQAKKKISGMKNLTVIGITGSYGKSSCKEFLYQLLSTKYKVLKTPANINTDIGIAGIILNKLKAEHNVFIVEMGAYRMGEIANICKMRRPDIGILTAVAKQHLSLFGTLDNIKKAKSELLLAVQDDGLRIINGDNEHSSSIAKTLDLKSVTYGMSNPQVDYKITDAKDNGDSVSFRVEGIDINAKVLGLHQALNVTAAIIAAKELGMTNVEIQEAASTITPPKAVLSLQAGYRGSIILNDSYNSNPDGFMAAINVTKNQKVQGKKILITMGMIELGKESDQLHNEVAKHAKGVFDTIIITRKEAYRPFAKEIPENKIKLIEDPEVLFKYIKKNVEQYDLVLVENRLYEYILNFLLQK